MFVSDRVWKKHLTFLIGASDKLYCQGFTKGCLEVSICTTSQNARMAKTRNESLEIPYDSTHIWGSKTLTRMRIFLSDLFKNFFPVNYATGWSKQELSSCTVWAYILLGDDTFHCDICRINDYHSPWKSLAIFIDHIQILETTIS